MGATRSHRRVDRSSARSHSPADPGVQARARAGARRRRGRRRRDHRRGRTARVRRRGDRRRARGGGGAPRGGGGEGRRGGRAQGGRGGGRRRGGGGAEARPRAAARPPPQAHRRAARGHVRPRRGRLRPVARPRRRGRPRLRRALGRPPARRGHDRGGPDRDPPRRRRRGRRRLSPPSGPSRNVPPEIDDGCPLAEQRTGTPPCVVLDPRNRSGIPSGLCPSLTVPAAGLSRGTSREDPLDRILAHLYAIEDAVAERTEPLPYGTAVFHDRVPWVREVNVVRVEATAPRIRAGDLAFAAERRFPTAPAVEVLHEPIGAALAPAVAPDAVWALREEWMRSEPWGDDAAVMAMLRWERWRAELTGARAFCAFDGGRPVSMCLLLATPHADEVERVYTTPTHRGRGLAYAVVGRALREAGDQLTFLFTDAHGAAQHLYARLGFKRGWVVYRFVLRPPEKSTALRT